MDILQLASNYIFQLFNNQLRPVYVYHDFAHTQRVVNAAKELAVAEQLDDVDQEDLLLAAWFHDAGYTQCGEGHEKQSGEIAYAFLREKGMEEPRAQRIANLILVTERHAVPTTAVERCLRDADYIHLTLPNYLFYCQLLRDELQKTCNLEVSEAEWCQGNIDFFSREHRFYTEYAQQHWQPLKEANLKELYTQLQKLNENVLSNKELKKKKLEKLERPERGIDTLFRVTLNNHTQLSAIADSKANILLSVNTIIISVALTAIMPKLDNPNNAHLIVPTFILLLSSTATIVITIMSTIPKVSTGHFSEEDLKNRKVNLLFFGNFFQMPLERYTSAVNEMMNDREYLYDNLIRDLHQLGVVLNKKYRMLRIAYGFFMLGILSAVSAYLLAFIFLNR